MDVVNLYIALTGLCWLTLPVDGGGLIAHQLGFLLLVGLCCLLISWAA